MVSVLLSRQGTISIIKEAKHPTVFDKIWCSSRFHICSSIISNNHKRFSKMFQFFFKFTLFTDDSTLTCSFNNMTVESITSCINQNLETGDHQPNVNKLKVNTHKSYHVVFSYRKKILIPPIRLESVMISQTETNNFQE